MTQRQFWRRVRGARGAVALGLPEGWIDPLLRHPHREVRGPTAGLSLKF